MRRYLSLIPAMLFVLVAVPAYAVDKDCADFTDQGAAQAYFKAGGGSESFNYNRLDGDHDGIACEQLPAGADEPAGPETLPFTGPSGAALPVGAGLLAAGVLAVVATRYRPLHVRK